MIRAALVAAVTLLVAILLLWFGYGEARAIVKRSRARFREWFQAPRFAYARLSAAPGTRASLDPRLRLRHNLAARPGYPRGA
jgi:hypothetical protein